MWLRRILNLTLVVALCQLVPQTDPSKVWTFLDFGQFGCFDLEFNFVIISESHLWSRVIEIFRGLRVSIH